MARILLILFLLNSAAFSDTAVSFMYKEWNKGIPYNTHFGVSARSGGYIVLVTCTTETERTKEVMMCDSTFATLQLHFLSTANTDMYFKRSGNSIEAQGLFLGKPEKRVLSIDKNPWYQIISFGIQAASKDPSGGKKLWSISLHKPAMLQPVCFRITNAAKTPLPGHPEILCRSFRVKIEGLSAYFWSGDYFLRQDDGAFLYYEGHLFGSRSPTETIECVF